MIGNPYVESDLKRTARHVYERPLHQPGAAQMPLDLTPPQPAEAELTIEARFLEFHTHNPHVYRRLREMALAQAQAGARRISPKLLFEQLRAQGTATDSQDEFELNNIYTSRYARLLAAEPELSGRIPMRRLLAE